jgi:rare lipoprotein A
MHFSIRCAIGACFLAAILALSSCSKKNISRASVPRAIIGHTEQGIASWYGDPYHGRRAANGEIYDMEKMTAAHKTIPFETWVRVRNLSNKKICDVRITDRGPFFDGRIIDLSRAAARSIDMIGPGTARVKLTVIKPPNGFMYPEFFYVQAGVFRDRSRAESLSRELGRKYEYAKVFETADGAGKWRVLVGKEISMTVAKDLAKKVRADAPGAIVVKLDTK